MAGINLSWTPATLPASRFPTIEPLDLSPISNGLDAVAKSNKEARDLAVRQSAGTKIAAGDTAGAENELFNAGYLDQGLTLQNTAAAQKRNAAQDQALIVSRAGGLSQIGLNESDPNRKTAIVNRIFALDPKMKDSIAADGVDLSNPDAVFKYVQSEAAGYKGYQDPNELEAQKLGLEKDRATIDLTKAQTKAANEKADDPLAQFLANKLNPSTNGQSAPSSTLHPPAPNPVQPQSFETAPQQPMLQPTSNVTTPPPQQPAQPGPQLNPGVVLTGNETPSTEPQPEAPQTPQVQSPGAVYSMPGDEIVQTPLGPMSRDQARTIGALAAAKGRGDFGKMMIDAASGGPQRLGQTGANQNDKNSIGTVDELAGLDNIKRAYDAKFLTIPKRIGYAWSSILSKFGKLKPEDAKELQDYATFRAASFDQLNKKLKELSGTAVTPQEAERQLIVLPNAGQGIGDGDSPAEFEAKLNASIAWQKSAFARQNYLRNQGFQGKPWEAGVAVEDMPQIINQRGQQLRQQLQQQFPKASPMQLDQTVTKKIKKEFGI
jgi:hypothetical protein